MSPMSFATILRFSLELIVTVFLVAVSYCFHRIFRHHRLSIQHISLATLTAHGVRCEGRLYNATYTYTLTSSNVAVRLHWPTPRQPRWLTFTARDLRYVSSTCDISLAALDVTAWFFPLLFRQTAGPWTSIRLDDYRVRVYKSNQTPSYIKSLRKNVVSAVLTGQIIRADNFWTNVQLEGVSEAGVPRRGNNGGSVSDAGSDSESGDYSDSDEDSSGTTEDHARHTMQVFRSTADKDEVRISAFVRQLHIDSMRGRIYTFGAVDAQLRRDWDTDRGSFVMIARESRWVRVPWSYQRQAIGWWAQLATSLMQFALDLSRAISHPMTMVDLYISHTNITFDEFRIRDAELVMQAFSLATEKTRASKIEWSGVFLDALAGLVAPG